MTARLLAVLAALGCFCPLVRVHADEPKSKTPRSPMVSARSDGRVVVRAADVDPTVGATPPGTPLVMDKATGITVVAQTEPVPAPPAAEAVPAPPAAEIVPPGADAIPTEAVPAEGAPMVESPIIASDIVSPEEVVGQGYKTCFIEDFNFDYPLWYVRADGNWLNRTTQTDVTTATVRYQDGTIGNNRISSLGFDSTPGMRAFFGRNIWDGMTYIEAGYFGLNHWNDLIELRNENGFGIIKSNLDLGFGNNTRPDFQHVDYSSTIHNAELNIRTFFSPRFAFVGGLRYFNLNETLVIGERGQADNITLPTDPVRSGTVQYLNWRNVSTDNNLLGPQMGLDWMYEVTDDIRINLLSRVALCANFSQSTVRQSRDAVEINRGLDGATIRDARVVNDEETVIAGLLELHSSVDILLTKNILFRGGWQFMWISGIALAPEQHADPITNPNGVQRQIENGADAIFFGPFVGLEVYWGGVNY